MAGDAMSKSKDLGPAGGIYSAFVKPLELGMLGRYAYLGQRVVELVRDYEENSGMGDGARIRFVGDVRSSVHALGLLGEKEAKP